MNWLLQVGGNELPCSDKCCNLITDPFSDDGVHQVPPLHSITWRNGRGHEIKCNSMDFVWCHEESWESEAVEATLRSKMTLHQRLPQIHDQTGNCARIPHPFSVVGFHCLLGYLFIYLIWAGKMFLFHFLCRFDLSGQATQEGHLPSPSLSFFLSFFLSFYLSILLSYFSFSFTSSSISIN